MGRNLCQVSEPFSGLARGQSFVHGSVPASRSGLASGIKGRLGSGAEPGRKVAKGLSLVFWCLKLVNKVGKGFFFQLVPVLVHWEQPKCLAARGKVARRQAHTRGWKQRLLLITELFLPQYHLSKAL